MWKKEGKQGGLISKGKDKDKQGRLKMIRWQGGTEEWYKGGGVHVGERRAWKRNKKQYFIVFLYVVSFLLFETVSHFLLLLFSVNFSFWLLLFALSVCSFCFLFIFHCCLSLSIFLYSRLFILLYSHCTKGEVKEQVDHPHVTWSPAREDSSLWKSRAST